MSLEQMPMASPEHAPINFDNEFDFGLDDFDINAAFQDALTGVATAEDLANDEKVVCMEVLIAEGTSEAYRDFVDMRAMAAQIEMICNHDHALNEAMGGSESLMGFRDEHTAEDGHTHSHEHKPNEDDDDDDEEDKNGKKKKGRRKRRWLK